VLGVAPGPALDYVRDPGKVSVELVGENDPAPASAATTTEGSEQ
jgi:NADH-quinone oxidoreductase subunit M